MDEPKTLLKYPEQPSWFVSLRSRRKARSARARSTDSSPCSRTSGREKASHRCCWA